MKSGTWRRVCMLSRPQNHIGCARDPNDVGDVQHLGCGQRVSRTASLNPPTEDLDFRTPPTRTSETDKTRRNL